MATQPQLANVQVIIGYTFSDPLLLRQALTAPGSHTNPPDGNRRLALLGDAVLKLALLERWHQTPGATRADGDRVLQNVATNSNLNTRGRIANLAGFIIGNPSQAPGAIFQRTMADTVEAILGAVYEDANYNLGSVKPVMRTLGLVPV